MNRDVIEISSGAVRGFHDGGVWTFRGIPYAADTSGEGRFRPPRNPRHWPGVRDCSDYGPSCPQMTLEEMLGIALQPEAAALMGSLLAEPSLSEDCLVLNVWTPSLDATAGLPVLVWLHGGGWSTGSASWPLYDFTNAAGRGNAVFVGVNHRVGILGFLDVSHLGEEFANSGNVGMLDLVAALEWVHANIAAFGGDPGNVTVFGESGGGAKTTALLAMPAGQGLFHHACVMSGALLSAQQPDHAAVDTRAVLEHLGIGDDVEKLQAIDVGRLIDAEVELPGRHRGALARGRLLSPVLGPSLPEHAEAALRAGLNADVTLMIGCTADETIAFLIGDPDLWTLRIEDLPGRLRPLLGDDTDHVLAAYRGIQPDASPTSLLIDITTDALWRVPHIRIAEAKLDGGGSAPYMYRFAWGYPDPSGRVRSFHGADMPYFFDNADKAVIAQGPHGAPLVAAANGALLALAHRGDPNHERLPEWPTYDTDERATMRIDVESTIELDPLGRERRAWDGIRLIGLGPSV